MRVAAGTDTVAVVPWPIGDGGLANGLVGFVAGSENERRRGDRSVPRLVARATWCRAALFQIADWPLNANGKTDYKSLGGLLEKANG